MATITYPTSWPKQRPNSGYWSPALSPLCCTPKCGAESMQTLAQSRNACQPPVSAR
jgi:hypothetical protein